ncbi:hypothetical protein JB92DRAFT_2824765 [Gautieria morchelliformis]|nr:hypothetical protein JB92DRAFT_2824765 [Gautieria morchelliformis]
MEAQIVKLSKRIDRITEWIEEKDEIISNLKQISKEQYEKPRKLSTVYRKKKDLVSYNIIDNRINFMTKQHHKPEPMVHAQKESQLTQEEISDGEEISPLTAHDEEDDLVLYEVNDNNQINLLTKPDKNRAKDSSANKSLQRSKTRSNPDKQSKLVEISRDGLKIVGYIIQQIITLELADMDVFMDGEEISPLTVYDEEDDLVSYENNQINHIMLEISKESQQVVEYTIWKIVTMSWQIWMYI